ncbi:fanconi-associated nuclease 1 isoform X2 [Copidosoma floridanum]|uniref:fanconi-associated nuclease 1 isoform X2 n=1 Tax=Copidosoma floridanum TaxID=29053 RepID=UPI000C6F5927|nr:fanconi-associated nuclease 1 isoform X2 [Copidosoma floridanum]
MKQNVKTFKMPSQTTLDKYYKVIYNKKVSQKEILVEKEGGNGKGSYHRNPFALRKSRMRPTKMLNFVESEVQIIKVCRPSAITENESTNNQKRTNSSELGSLHKKAKTTFPETPRKNGYQTPLKVTSPNKLNSTGKKSNFLPKEMTPQKKISPSKTISPRKLFFADRVIIDTVQQAVENLNLVRQGSITLNEFDLESIYEEKNFSFVYSDNIDPTSQKFELKDIIFPREKHADHLLMIVMDVFSEPMNCGYFLKDELNKIFQLFTLSLEAQTLFVRLLKRKIGWHRTSNIKYLEIASDLTPFFKELIEKGFCTSDLNSMDVSILLNMLQADEVKHMCQKLKIDHRGNKAVLINRLEKYGNSAKSFFLGAKTPKSILRSEVLSVLQLCVTLPQEIFNLFDRVMTLLHPMQDPTESIADLFLMLTTVHKGEILYPYVPKKDPYPVFQNRSHLIGYVESKNAYRQVLTAIENKEWDIVKKLGRIALKNLKEGQENYVKNSLPLHVRKFVPEYEWTKVLSRSIDAFKKNPETIPEAVNALQALIDDKHFCQSSRGKWYSELALIEMHHKKDLETSAALTLHALQQDTLTEVDASGLISRLVKLMRRKTGISAETKVKIQMTLDEVTKKGLTPLPVNTKTVTAIMANRAESTGQTTWSIKINGHDKYYGRVEVVALQHYTSEEDFHEGLHCEGSLPITLFTIFFWEELFNVSVPGVFVSSYQEAPLDLFTAEFFNNRKEKIEEKIQFIKALDLETFADWMYTKYSNNIQYRTIMPNTLFKSDQQFKEVVTCLGINAVVGICQKLVSNYRLWRSGFPDLIVWNKLIPKCKIIEVKGPGDSLSEKQKLWLQYLEQLGVEVQVCLVEALGRSSK